MIGRINRFHGHNSLRHVYQRGRVVRSSLFAIRTLPNDRRQTYRAAVVVSKKVNKSAVVRNRIRRRMYEQVRLVGHQFNRPYDLVITVFSDNVATMPVQELTDGFQQQIRQAHLIKKL